MTNNFETETYIITGATSGVGRTTARAMTKEGTLVLVGRDPHKLEETGYEISQLGGQVVTVVCDLSDLVSVSRAAQEIAKPRKPLTGLLNNAGVQNPAISKTSAGWDTTFVINHLGPFQFTEALLPHLKDGANVLFVGSATEDPERRPAKRAGFRGGQYLSAEASLRGEWKPGGSVRPGMDAYATSKQCNIITALVLARENPRLRINAIEPGIMFQTGLHAHMSANRRVLMAVLVPVLLPFVKVLSKPEKAARVICNLLTDPSGPTGMYFDESGHPMQGSALLRNTAFQDQVINETRALLTELRPS